MIRHSSAQFSLVVVLAVVACGAGMLFIPWLWPALRIFGWLLPVGPTLGVLLFGFDRMRSSFSGAAFYKELFGRVALLGAVIIVGWVAVLEYVAQTPFIIIAIPVTGCVSLTLLGSGCAIYAILRKPGSRPESNFIQCPECGYRIDNISGPNCPECGRRFVAEPDNWKPTSLKRQAQSAAPAKNES